MGAAPGLGGTSSLPLSLWPPPPSSGKLVPGCQVKLVNQDADGAGEICLWGRSIFMGYLNKEDKTCECIDADGWLHTGDIGRLDADGFLYITGRIKGVGLQRGHATGAGLQQGHATLPLPLTCATSSGLTGPWVPPPRETSLWSPLM